MVELGAAATKRRPVEARVFRRIVPFLALCCIMHLIDRANIGFAALTMNKDLGLSATSFGLATGLYSAAYVLAEIPSNIMMTKLGARIWIARIMITWGIATAATAFAVGPNSLYLSRILLGLSEAGFIPGVLLYLSFWITPNRRANATSVFLLAQPAGLIVAGLISGPMLAMDGVAGIAGWRWLFLLQGFPAVLLGVIVAIYLTDRPSQAKWLSNEERSELQRLLPDAESEPPRSHWRLIPELLKSPAILLLSLAYFGLSSSLSSYGAWAPLIVREVLPETNVSLLSKLMAVPAVVCILVMLVWGRNSDRNEERRWHTVIPIGLAAFGWFLIAFSNSPLLKFVGLAAVLTGCFTAQGIFWAVAALRLPAQARPVGLAMISSIGLLGGALGPLMVGWLVDIFGNFRAGLEYLAGMLLLAAVCVLILGDAKQLDAPKAG